MALLFPAVSSGVLLRVGALGFGSQKSRGHRTLCFLMLLRLPGQASGALAATPRPAPARYFRPSAHISASAASAIRLAAVPAV